MDHVGVFQIMLHFSKFLIHVKYYNGFLLELHQVPVLVYIHNERPKNVKTKLITMIYLNIREKQISIFRLT